MTPRLKVVKNNSKQTTSVRSIWVGYSWIPNPEMTKVAICTVTEDDNNGIDELKHSWKVDIDPSIFPETGLKDPLGISTFTGFHNNSLSLAFNSANDWESTCLEYDRIFEKNLALLLYAKICSLLNTHHKSYRDQKTVVTVQGPIFPEMLDCLSNLDDFTKSGFLVNFLTFSQRYLQPNPLEISKAVFDNGEMPIYGPEPSMNEESLTKKYYLGTRPARPSEIEAAGTHIAPFYPIMLEMPFSARSNEIHETALNAVLEGNGLKRENSAIIFSNASGGPYRNFEAFPEDGLIKTHVPSGLVKANRGSWRSLEGEARVDPPSHSDLTSPTMTGSAPQLSEEDIVDEAARGVGGDWESAFISSRIKDYTEYIQTEGTGMSFEDVRNGFLSKFKTDFEKFKGERKANKKFEKNGKSE